MKDKDLANMGTPRYNVIDILHKRSRTMGENTKMGRPRKYSRQQARVVKNKQINAYVKATYEKLQESVPKGTNQRLKDASAFEGMSKRAYLLSAIENRLEITEKISKKS